VAIVRAHVYNCGLCVGVSMASDKSRADRIAIVGGATLAALFVFTVLGPDIPDPATLTLLILQAMSAGAVAGALGGRVSAGGEFLKFSIRAGGALAFALLVFVAGWTQQQKSEKAIKINSPTLERINGAVNFVTRDVFLGPNASGTINSPDVRDTDGGANFHYGNVEKE
jgi:hypothetical protein